MKVLLVLIAICLLAVTVLARPEPTYIAEVAPRLVHRAHLFHGINYSTFDHQTGERWFERNGQRCPLFTEAFWQKEVKP